MSEAVLGRRSARERRQGEGQAQQCGEDHRPAKTSAHDVPQEASLIILCENSGVNKKNGGARTGIRRYTVLDGRTGVLPDPCRTRLPLLRFAYLISSWLLS